MSAFSSGANGLARSAASALNPAAARDAADPQMDQIRDLLFGQFKAEIAAHVAALESRVVDLERQLAAARAEDAAKRRAAFDDIAKGLATLSEQVRQIART